MTEINVGDIVRVRDSPLVYEKYRDTKAEVLKTGDVFSLKSLEYNDEKGDLDAEHVELLRPVCQSCGNKQIYHDSEEEYFCPFCDS